MATGRWGLSDWGDSQWTVRHFAPGAAWRDDWRWWYQLGYQTQAPWDLTQKVVEARWTTDAYAMGDGTFRGDLQPGHLELRLFDPTGQLVGLSTMGTIWARYKPSGATWCWFVHQVTSILAGDPHDPLRHNVVVSCDTWPVRLTTTSYGAGRPAETVNQRLTFLVGALDADTGLSLPHWSGDIAADTHQVTAHLLDALGLGQPWLQLIRDAAANGCAWLEATATDTDYTPGALTLHYDTWGTVAARTMFEDQYNAGTPWAYGNDFTITQVQWVGTPPSGAATTVDQISAGRGSYGLTKLGPMRVWGTISAGGAQEAAVKATGTTVMTDHGQPTQRVDRITAISGDRATPTGQPSVVWDPRSMVWTPRNVMQWNRAGAAGLETYRVVQTAHLLNSRTWEATHTLEMFSAPTALP